ncbi:murein biosynthesis integral membrane protein MurJ [Candidatus Nomurabacteria bacterium]|nr:murein biosynthesis integral membrane protein MurJ [Candidatus Nomurabacteria bacterium]
MWSKFWHKINNTVAGGAVIIACFSFLSKILALLRERLIAHNFAASEISDVYYAAFRLPDLIFNTLVLGALTSAFIPVFQKVWNKNKEEGLILANSVLNLFLVIIFFLSLGAFLFAPQIMKVLTPGFSDWQMIKVTQMTRVMLLSILFFVASNVAGGILNSWKRFFSFSLAASFYNLGIIFGIIFLYPILGLNALAWGVVVGAALHLLVQLPELIKHGFRYRPVLKINAELKRILFLMLPRTLGLAAGQINLIFITMIASSLTVGSIAIFNFANNLQSLPISLFAVSLAIAVFPTFTQAIQEENKELFAQHFSNSFRRILFVLIPLSILIVILRAQIVRVILGTGAFTWEDTYYTAQTLGFFAISIFAQGLIPILARSFYAWEDTKTPMLVSIFSILVNIALSFLLVRHLQVMGLALAFSLSSILNMVLLYLLLHKKNKDLDDQKIFFSIIKISLISIPTGAITYLALQFLSTIVDMRTFLGILIQGFGAGLVGLIIYLILAIVFKLEEIDLVRKLLKRLLKVVH